MMMYLPWVIECLSAIIPWPTRVCADENCLLIGPAPRYSTLLLCNGRPSQDCWRTYPSFSGGGGENKKECRVPREKEGALETLSLSGAKNKLQKKNPDASLFQTSCPLQSLSTLYILLEAPWYST
ncbi:hypothetical protein BX666DRAFT_961448 [Dichotomocladium elegans]|nr:hypothetical protein BX666DRAFT_961448 [Dichotomocladium elegans]